MFSAMENSESGDEVSHGFLSGDQPYILSNDEVLEPGDNTDDSSHDQYKNVPLREQDRFLPIANIAKIMKRAIPDNGKIAKDAREILQECVSEFISFVTSEASDRCRFEKRKTINGEDILFAMTTLGFDNYVEPLKVYLQKYREMTLNTARIEKQVGSGIAYAEISDERYESKIQ
ncbi:uncharacterized protein LOC143912467 isoform X2 [Arctopsyche grandis]|uniref:uncharacterized protein LOC143912467 isoform X2 n=1 Tax=Arctopsyche grandis TaxID=121162 RepID=UPI00406D9FF6